jgi:hypothetical protein
VEYLLNSFNSFRTAVSAELTVNTIKKQQNINEEITENGLWMFYLHFHRYSTLSFDSLLFSSVEIIHSVRFSVYHFHC